MNGPNAARNARHGAAGRGRCSLPFALDVGDGAAGFGSRPGRSAEADHSGREGRISPRDSEIRQRGFGAAVDRERASICSLKIDDTGPRTPRFEADEGDVAPRQLVPAAGQPANGLPPI